MRLEGRVAALAYQRVLEDHMLHDAQRLIGEEFVFQHDNAPIHAARPTRQWLRHNCVTILDWSPQSSDANPIENMLHTLKV